MNLKGKRIFVSGGAGVIGPPLVEQLVEQGAIVWVGDLKPRPLRLPKCVRYRQGDLNCLTQEEVEDFNPEIFFHLAATFERTEEQFSFFEENYKHNVLLSHHLLALHKGLNNLESVIFASSYLIYDAQLYLRSKPLGSPYALNEKDPIRPRNLTGGAKLNSEVELDFLNSFLGKDCRFVLARIFRSYGRASRDVISRWTRSLLNGEKISVYGQESSFDYVYADDVAEGLLRMAKAEGLCGVCNLSRGRARKVSEVVEVLRKYFPEANIEYGDQIGLYEESEADLTQLKDALGWRPTIDIEEGIVRIIDYEKKADQEVIETVGNILITSLSKKIPLVECVRAAVQKLGSNVKIWGGDLESDCLGRYYVDAFWKMPRLDALTLDVFINFCTKNNIRFIVPTRDGELEYFAKHRESFAGNGISVMVSSEATVARCLNKLEFYKALNTEGYPVIQTFETLVEAEAVGSWVVKECVGAGSRGVGINLSRDRAGIHGESLESPVYQPYVDGREFSADVYVCRNGKVKGVVLRWRELIVEGESQITSTFSDPGVEAEIASMAQFLGISGHAVFQGIIDEHGKTNIIEVNCRFGGASSLSISVGLDTFYWFMIESLGEDLDNYPFIKTGEKRLIRAPKDLVLELNK